MYSLRSVTFDRDFGVFDSVSEAADEAMFAGLPQEEFAVTREEDGLVVSKVFVRNFTPDGF